MRITEIDAENARLLNLPAAVAEVLTELREAEPGLNVTGLDQRLQELLSARQDVLRKLKRDYETYSTDLIELATAQNNLLSRVDQIGSFIDERVLWVRSTSPLHRIDLSLNVAGWSGALVTLANAWLAEVRRLWWAYAIAGVLFAGFLWRQRHLREDLRQTCEAVSKPLTDRCTLTLRALFDTVAIAVPVPLLLWLAAWRIQKLDVAADPLAFDAAIAFGRALVGGGGILLLLVFARHACRRYGLATGHLRWDAKALGALRRHLIWFAPVLTPLVLLIIASERSSDNTLSASFGRLAFLLAMVATVLFARQVFHPDRGVLAHYFAKRATSLPGRLRWPIYLASQLLLIGLAGASALGYHYTALVLSEALVSMLVLTAGVVLVHALAVRWVVYTQRKLAIEEARQRRAEQAAEQQGEDATAKPDIELNEAGLKIGAIGEQTRQLLTSFAWVGVVVVAWFAWADLLPAFSFLQEVQLWSYTSEVATTTAAGEVTTQTVLRDITLASVLLVILILVVAYVLTRNLPGLLEIAILRRLPLDTGARFAISAVSRYIITVVGVVLAFGTLGIGWSSVQWLVAAITVGLGFGLQEIFANFVSGLILLFERPIRIGDTVTVGNVTGTVTRIRIRATTITDWDRKELVIPNKEFVTGQVINWTLTDQVLRQIVKVGIAYGSDTAKAKQILLDIAKENPRVLDQPKPHAWFMEFGDSSLNFEMRVFVKDIDDWIITRDALHFEIDNAFRAAGIEIAFPQRDLHVRSIDQALVVDQQQDGITAAALERKER